jgi:hypothetical protein
MMELPEIEFLLNYLTIFSPRTIGAANDHSDLINVWRFKLDASQGLKGLVLGVSRCRG